MNINSDNLADAAQDSSRVARMIDEKGYAVILKNNYPRCLIIESEKEQLANDEDLLKVSRRLIAKNREAYGELAK
ncbi:type II toxin-antitoxin system Phd/YefM family antitoxin [bacterium]|nr:type II toxin-antitoxin system Phd/YefM family antitoxin [bacterium]